MDETDNDVIKVRAVCKSFNDVDVLKSVDLTVARAENVAILGRSGSGKSVFIKILVGLMTPDSGQVEVLGKNVAELTRVELDKLRLNVGFSFQSSALYDSMNVYENIAFPLSMNSPGISREELGKSVEEVLNAVGLKEKARELPADLSGGQRKRVGIARTLVLKPKIVLYDEPTAGLDPVTSMEIITLINQVRQLYNTTSVIITHDLTCAKKTADRVAMLIDGKFTRIGTFENVFETDDEQIKSFYNYNFIQ
jgi:phospholipid/cholesterol/gamma-HCH transport system ATP-binding protein